MFQQALTNPEQSDRYNPWPYVMYCLAFGVQLYLIPDFSHAAATV